MEVRFGWWRLLLRDTNHITSQAYLFGMYVGGDKGKKGFSLSSPSPSPSLYIHQCSLVMIKQSDKSTLLQHHHSNLSSLYNKID